MFWLAGKVLAVQEALPLVCTSVVLRCPVVTAVTVRNYTFYPRRKFYIFVKTCQSEPLFPCTASSGLYNGSIMCSV